MLELIYFILIAVVLSAIVLSLGIELRHHHAKHLISGVFVIILLVGLTYLYQHISGLGGVAILWSFLGYNIYGPTGKGRLVVNEETKLVELSFSAPGESVEEHDKMAEETREFHFLPYLQHWR